MSKSTQTDSDRRDLLAKVDSGLFVSETAVHNLYIQSINYLTPLSYPCQAKKAWQNSYRINILEGWALAGIPPMPSAAEDRRHCHIFRYRQVKGDLI
jgi:hypothetical protein